MKRIFSLLSAALILSSVNAQIFVNRDQEEFKEDKIFAKPVKAQYKLADGYWEDQNYDFALRIYKNIEKDVDQTAYFQFKIGDCYANSMLYRDISKANTYLEEAVKKVSTNLAYDYYDNEQDSAPVNAYMMYGKILRMNHEFEKAKANFKAFADVFGNKITPEEKAEVEREIKICETAKLLVANPIEINVTSLGNVVNSKFPDYAPVLSADEQTLIFTSRRGEEGEAVDPIDFKFYEDIFISKKDKEGKWSAPKKIQEINTPGHEATIGLSVDGQQLLIYSTQDDNEGDIYYSKLDGNNWTKPVAFDALNSNAAETHACFSADGKTIYFTSNRKGGYGGYDLYRVTQLPNGTWSKPLNLGPKINTEFDERAPFIHPDGVSLFFSSNGHETMGGFDIFQSTMRDENEWSTPENIGYPINTTADEMFYVTSVDGKRSYYASLRPEGVGEKDIYLITLPKRKNINPLTVMSGTFSLGDKDQTVPADAQIIVKDNETGEIVGIYKPNKRTGKYLFILPPGKNYNVTYEAEGYLFKSENLIVPKNSSFQSMKREIRLAPIKANESIVLNNVFFEFDSDKLTADSKTELNKLFSLLSNNPSIKVEIQGHTDSKGNDKYNMKLSQKRAESVKNYLTKKGIKASRITAKGYGETQPIAKNQNDDGSDNEEGRALNRRIELKILGNDGEKKGTVNDIYVPDQLKK